MLSTAAISESIGTPTMLVFLGERRWLGRVAIFAEQTCFVGKLAILPLHIEEGP
jgi:hypothetical protein